MVNDGPRLNIFPISTLTQLMFNFRKLQHDQVNVRAFSAVQRNTVVAVNLVNYMGQGVFSVDFQVLDINTS